MTIETVIASLKPEFADKVRLLVANCAADGLVIEPYSGLRTCAEQAKLWRQSRTAQQVQQAIADLTSRGAPYLASVLDSVGPQSGDPVTNALPGDGWHNWGEAVDCFVMRDGQRVLNGGDPLYITYAVHAEEIGLTAGLRWQHPDFDHIQLRAASSPITAGLTWAEIDAAMKALGG